MAQSDLNDPLSPAKFNSLRELSAELGWKPLPSLHTAKLLRLGYARDAVGGLSISELGQLRVAKGSSAGDRARFASRRLAQERYRRSFDRVAREHEIADPRQPFALPIEQHEIAWRRFRIVAIADQRRQPAIDHPRHERQKSASA